MLLTYTDLLREIFRKLIQKYCNTIRSTRPRECEQKSWPYARQQRLSPSVMLGIDAFTVGTMVSCKRSFLFVVDFNLVLLSMMIVRLRWGSRM